jgi:hypothetical protein
MLAADTRVSWFPPDRPMAYRDEQTKISRTSLGLITGTGLISLLDAVKRRLDFEHVFPSDRIVAVAREERRRFEDDPRYQHDPRVAESLQTTGWLFTYFTPTDDGYRLRLAVCHPATDYELALVNENAGFVMMPAGATPDQVESISQWLQEDLVPLAELPDLEKSIQHHALVAAAITRSVADEFDSVSRSFHIGIQTIDGSSGISPFIDGSGAWSFALEPPGGPGPPARGVT